MHLAHMRQSAMQALAVSCALQRSNVKVIPVLARVHVPEAVAIDPTQVETSVAFGPAIQGIKSRAARLILADVMDDNNVAIGALIQPRGGSRDQFRTPTPDLIKWLRTPSLPAPGDWAYSQWCA